MATHSYRVPVEELEGRARVPRHDQVTSVGDGMGPPPVHSLGAGEDAADGDGD